MKNPAVDAYIAKAAPFARPLLKKIRSLFHRACPGIEEKMRWGCPSFDRDGMVGGMAAFKNHAGFGLWRHRELADPRGLFQTQSPWGAGKLTDLSQLPADGVLLDYIRAAVALNASGKKPSRPKTKPKPPPKVPPFFRAALKKTPKALAAFEAFPPSHRREYVEWIVEAKTAETRERRMSTALAWIAAGKSKNWKYR